jgi:predicted HicB family RNase H-like nuclease
MSKYKDVFNAKKKLEEKIDRNPEIQKSRNKIEPEKQVNLGIKINESRRRHWVGQAKLQGITISEVIIEALAKKFGEPE